MLAERLVYLKDYYVMASSIVSVAYFPLALN